MELFEILRFDEFKKEHELEESVLVNYCPGFDSCVYLLFLKSPPKPIIQGIGVFVDTNANAEYIVARITIDWDEGKPITTKIYPLGRHRMNYHFIRPLFGDFLLLGARCHFYHSNDIEQNALCIDEAGNKKYEMCLGDGIEDCITTEDGRIITSYFDEGVFGNYGWDLPIGSSGLIVWDSVGRKLWENKKYDICDCYAMNIDDNDNLWFYYYTEFKLVQTDLKNDIVMDPQVSGAHAFSVSRNRKRIIISGGYNDDDYYCCGIEKSKKKLGKKAKVTLELDNKACNVSSCHFRGSKLLFITEGNILCGLYFV